MLQMIESFAGLVRELKLSKFPNLNAKEERETCSRYLALGSGSSPRVAGLFLANALH